MTGDPGTALPALTRQLDAGMRHEQLRELGDPGTLAAGTADRLRQLAGSGDDWVRAEAAYAHHRVTGSAEVAVPVLTELVAPLAEGRCLPVMITALEHLAAIGPAAAADPVAAAGPAGAAGTVARAVLNSPRRLAYSGSWRVFAEDERLRAAADALA
ncbi:hypothetical protein AB0F81_09435 [Actinoplanes sp. NPDC024001]|uniref:hypothetical protein n=1 Tax=Actinoplanes sp. NPDC024001 TaxID=3154598 RepID=UPI0033D8F568